MTEQNPSENEISSKEGQQLGQYIRWGVSVFGSLAGAATLLYALGFLVVNISLLSYGVFEVGLLRERYVSAGAAFILLLVIIAVFWFFFFQSGLERFLGWLRLRWQNSKKRLRKNIGDKFLKWLNPQERPRLQKVNQFFKNLASSIGDIFRNTWGLRTVYNFFKNHGLAKLLILLVILLAIFVISFLATLFLGFIWKITTVPSDWMNAIKGLGNPAYRSQRASNILSTTPVFIWCVLVSAILAVWRTFMERDKIKTALKIEEREVGNKATEVISETTVEGEGIEAESEAVEAGKGVEVDSKAAEEKQETKVNNGTHGDDKKGPPAKNDKKPDLLETLKANWSYFLVTVFLFFALVVYARNVFPALPAAMGGGLPSVVQFSAKDDLDLQELVQLGIPIEENKPNLTRQITLIAQTGSSYIVLVSHPELKQNVAVSIPKDYVDGIIYYPEEYFLNDEYVAELRTQEGRDALAGDDYQTALEMFGKALDRKDDYQPALIGLGDAYVVQQIADGFTCMGEDCVILNAIEKYKEVLNQPRNGNRSGNGQVQGNEMTLFAEALYKLARAYALSPREMKGVILDFRCDPLTEVDGENNGKKSEDVLQAAKLALECAINLDKKTATPQNYAERAKSDDAFHRRDAALRTRQDFVKLLFTSLEDAVSGYSSEAINLQEVGQISAAIDRYNWAITILTNPDFELLVVRKDQPRLQFNRAGLYLESHQDERPLCKEFKKDENNSDKEVNCLEEAIKDYKAAVSLEPNNAKYLTALADAQREASQFEQAVETYKRVTMSEELSTYTLAWLGLGDTYILLGENLQAKDAYSRTVALQSGNADALFGRAKAEALIGGDMAQIINDLRQAISLEGTMLNKALEEPAFAQITDIKDLLSAERSFEAGQLNEREGNLEDAIQNYLEAITLDASNDAYHASLAKVYSELPTPRWIEAENAYQEAVKLSPDNDNYLFNLGEVYAAQGKFEEAMESFAAAIDINDGKAIYYDRLSATLIKVGLESEAFNAGEAAMALEPDNLDYRFHLAEIYRQIEGWDRAVVNYEKIIERDPEYGDAYCGLAIILYQRNERGDIDKAAAAYDRCLELPVTDYLKEQAELAKKSFDVQQNAVSEGDGSP
jgi:tetratricopeptide (TPR) repeat protein